ncbi:MAG: VanZ family protein [Parashewanella sp.]
MLNLSLIFKCLLLITLIVVSYLVFSKPTYSQGIPHIDKIGHLGSFFALSLLAHLAFKPKWIYLLLGLCLYAGLIEVVQSYLPYRSASWADFAADILGIVIFYIGLYIKRTFITDRK